MTKPFDKNCAVRERTANGVNVGRCWYYVGDNDICPRHGDASEVMRRYRETGELQEDPRGLSDKSPVV